MTTTIELNALQIGAAGELPVRYRLLKHGIESAGLTTDAGIDLVAYVPGASQPMTVQVKTTTGPHPATGRRMLEFPTFKPTCPAQWLAVVDLSRDAGWLFRMDKALQIARPCNGQLEVWWYLDPPAGSLVGVESDYDSYRIDTVADTLGSAKPSSSSTPAGPA